MKQRYYLLSFALLAGCTGEPADDLEDLPAVPPPPPPVPQVVRVQPVAPQPEAFPQLQPQPRPQPANPFAKAIQQAGGQFPPAQQPRLAMPLQPQFGALPAQEDPTPIFRRIYASYAAKVAEVEKVTQSIDTRDTKRRNKYYWDPINETAHGLENQYHVDSSLLAQVIQLGLREKWPNAKDGEACAKMLRRAKVERALAMRRADAQVGDVVLQQVLALAMQRTLSDYAAREAAFQAWARRMVTTGGR